jgi:CHAT domain-containing protein
MQKFVFTLMLFLVHTVCASFDNAETLRPTGLSRDPKPLRFIAEIEIELRSRNSLGIGFRRPELGHNNPDRPGNSAKLIENSHGQCQKKYPGPVDVQKRQQLKQLWSQLEIDNLPSIEKLAAYLLNKNEQSRLALWRVTNSAVLFEQLGDYRRALELYEVLYSVEVDGENKHSIILAATLDNIANLHLALRDYTSARKVIEQSILMKSKITGYEQNPRFFSKSYFLLGQYFISQNMLKEAAISLQTSIDIFEGANIDNFSLPDPINSLLCVMPLIGDTEGFIQLLQKSLNNKAIASNLIAPSLETLFFLAKSDPRYLRIASELALRSVDSRTISTASKSTDLAISRRNLTEIQSLKLREWQDLLTIYSPETYEEAYPQGIQGMPKDGVIKNEKVIAHIQKLKELQKELVGLGVDTRLHQPKTISISNLQASIDPDEAALIIHTTDSKTYVWTISKDGLSWEVISEKRESLLKSVKAIRNSLTFDKDIPFDSVESYRMYSTLFSKIGEKIKPFTRLLIYADGPLTTLPFGLLIKSPNESQNLNNADWLMRTHATTMLPSIGSILFKGSRVKSTAPKPLIAFADPIFSTLEAGSSARGQSFKSRNLPDFYRNSKLDYLALQSALTALPGTRKEVLSIAKILGAEQSDLKFGIEANEDVVKTVPLDRYRVVYFATHGLVTGELESYLKVGAEPALALTFPKIFSPRNDGLLKASEIKKLKLDADWVVLSACNTANTNDSEAEPLSGLASAFLYAGARSLLVSHWEVSDDYTVILMQTLFELKSAKPNLSHGQLLQEAQIKLIQNSLNNHYLHPRYWAPFVVFGD